jgi:two-component system OmpR family sensor kinase
MTTVAAVTTVAVVTTVAAVAAGKTGTTVATTEVAGALPATAEAAGALPGSKRGALLDGRYHLRWVPAGLRARILASFVALLALTTVASVLVTREVLLIRLDQRIGAELVQESAELRRLASGNDPETGERFGARTSRIFRVFLQRNVPSQNEAFITFVKGRPFLRSTSAVPYRLDRDRALVARWAGLRETDRGSVATPAGRVEYLALPLGVKGGPATGVFVAAIFRDRAKGEADAAVRAAGIAGITLLLLGSLLAWRLADRVVRPVAALTRTARSISETDLSSRIPVRGRDEVAQLADTFNAMVGRLEVAFDSQRRFMNDAAHELRTPLTIVRGHVELLEDDPDPRQETLALVTDELDRMRRIVDDLLVLANEQRPDFLSLSTVDVEKLTDELYAKMGALAPREWVLEARGQGVIVADRQRLTQAVMQLAQNAARYAEAEPIAVGSSVADGEASIWVRDNGPGIPLEDQPTIFERFRRGSGRDRSDGSGLGLAIVKTIAQAHGGRVELYSRPGGGSLFTVVIPVDQPLEDEVGTL